MRDQGVEVAVMAVNINDGSCAHFGSPLGDSFFIEQKSLTANFANFCKHNSKLKMISLYLYTLIMSHKSCNMLSIIN